jgi:DNA-binding NarL/FixJ family response regulator
MTRLLIADSKDVVRSGLRAMLKARPDWEVVAEAADGKEAILKAIETKPDIAVIDYLLPLVDSIEVTRQIRERGRNTEVLIFALDASNAPIDATLKAGARGYLSASGVQHYLVDAIESLVAHKPFFTPNVTEALLTSFLAETSSTSVLTNREQVVLKLVAEGHTNRETAAILDITVKTAETHRAAIMRKLNLQSHAHLVRYAVRNSHVEP